MTSSRPAAPAAPAEAPAPAATAAGRLYVGHVAHERVRPRRNQFRYRIYFLYVDIDRMDELATQVRRFGHNSGGLLRIDDRDHGPRDGSPLRPWIDATLAQTDIDLAGGHVFLLTFPRALGFSFYPASFWYCFHQDGSLRAILAEVHNTFGEHHNYLLHEGGTPMDWATMRPQVTKVFHVSPFIAMDARYTFRFTEPGEKLALSILDDVEGERLLVASIALAARPFADAELTRTLIRYGPMSLRAIKLILWQAVRLVFKRVGMYPKPAPPEKETSL